MGRNNIVLYVFMVYHKYDKKSAILYAHHRQIQELANAWLLKRPEINFLIHSVLLLTVSCWTFNPIKPKIANECICKFSPMGDQETWDFKPGICNYVDASTLLSRTRQRYLAVEIGTTILRTQARTLPVKLLIVHFIPIEK